VSKQASLQQVTIYHLEADAKFSRMMAMHYEQAPAFAASQQER